MYMITVVSVNRCVLATVNRAVNNGVNSLVNNFWKWLQHLAWSPRIYTEPRELRRIHQIDV